MILITYSFVFLVSCLILFLSGRVLVKALSRVASFLGWREFVLAFVIIALIGTAPNLFVGISAALHGIPQLSFGDVVGGNVIDLTLVIALAALIARGIPAQSRTVQTTSIFTFIIAIMPLLLILDGILGRGDALILILIFAIYLFWLFSKRERFSRIYEENEINVIKEFKVFVKEVGKMLLGIVFLVLAAEGIVRSAFVFVKSFHLSFPLVGILIVALGNALPETYFAIVSARSKKTWMILGDLMGAVIMSATLVLGIVALINPIEISSFSPYAVARFFLIISSLFFLIFIRTDREITKKEGIALLIIYILFVISELLMK